MNVVTQVRIKLFQNYSDFRKVGNIDVCVMMIFALQILFKTSSLSGRERGERGQFECMLNRNAAIVMDIFWPDVRDYSLHLWARRELTHTQTDKHIFTLYI